MSAKWTVLIVEDDAETGQKVASALGDEVRTRIAYNGQEAILFAGKRPPELVIIDLVIPIVNGLEVSRFFKHKFGRESVPILIVTEKGDEETRRECADIGCDDFLLSPWDLEELVVSANDLIALGRAENERVELEKKRQLAKKGLPPEEDNAEELIEAICSLRAAVADRLMRRGFPELARGHVTRIAELAPGHAALARLRADLD